MSVASSSTLSDSHINSTKEGAESAVTKQGPLPAADDAVLDTLRIDPEDSQLIDELFRISKESPKLIRSTTYAAPADPSITLRSWKMNEFKYYDIPSPFPTLARGLFTREVGQGKHQIVARGYDKFFNIGEVPWTTVSPGDAHSSNALQVVMSWPWYSIGSFYSIYFVSCSTGKM